jgi:outer membrane biosynthesis protein TonB
MSRSSRGKLLNITLIEERFGKSFLASIGVHIGMVAFLLGVPYLMPRPAAIRIGTGLGGGIGGEIYTVGVVDELSGGAGMTKPSLVPQPPALPEEAKAEPKPLAVPLPNTVEPKKKTKQTEEAGKKVPPPKDTNVIPTAPKPGAGGTGGMGGGSGGGRGGGIGVSIGSGTGGLGDSLYAQAVERRISSNWTKPAVGRDMKYEILYSFYIATDGTIYDIKKEKSSGIDEIDLTAERAIRFSNPLAPPPPEFQGRPIQFLAQFAN